MSLPPTLNARSLAKLLAPLLYKSESTILRDISRNPLSLPPPIRKSGKRKIWDTNEVLAWLFPNIGVVARDLQGKTEKLPEVPSLSEMLSMLSGVSPFKV